MNALVSYLYESWELIIIISTVLGIASSLWGFFAKKRIGRNVIAVILLIICCVGLLRFMCVEVPDLEGLTYTEAKRELEDKDLRVEFDSDIDDIEKIVYQEPGRGDVVLKKSVVTVYKTENMKGIINDGKKGEVKDSEDEENGDKTKESDEEDANGVDDYESEADETVQVPNLYLMECADADKVLHDIGLEWYSEEDYDARYVYYVNGQSIEAGTLVDKSTKIKLIIEPKIYQESLFDKSLFQGSLNKRTIYNDAITKDNGDTYRRFSFSFTDVSIPQKDYDWTYLLGGKYEKLSFAMGLSSQCRDTSGAVWFDFYGDGKMIGRTDQFTSGVKPASYEIDVSGVDKLRVVGGYKSANSQEAVFLLSDDFILSGRVKKEAQP